MQRARRPALLGAILVALPVLALGPTFGCGGGDGDGTTPPATPTLTSCSPSQGPTTGGTAVTILGTNLSGPATVTVGGTGATAVVVLNATTISAVTPPGTTGAARDVVVTTPVGSATLTGAFTYYPPPTITAVTPPVTSTFGGMQLVLKGTGFQANAPGPNSVTIGGTPATSVVTVDDLTIQCDAPAGPAGPATVTVSNLNGVATGAGLLSWFVPIFAADGGGLPAPPSWDLYAIDPATGVAYLIGPIGFPVTGMDFLPPGTLYGTTAPSSMVVPRQLITIDPTTGAGTLVGNLDDAAMVNHIVSDCSFFLGALYGCDGPGGALVTIALATGLVTVAGPAPTAPGGGFAVDVTNTVTYYMTASDLTMPLWTVNIPTAVFVPGPFLVGVLGPGARITGATFHNGTLYALEALPGPGARVLLTVNTAAGVGAPVPGPPLPPYLSAIASPTR